MEGLRSKTYSEAVDALLAIFLEAAGDAPAEASPEQQARDGVAAVYRAICGEVAALVKEGRLVEVFRDAEMRVYHANSAVLAELARAMSTYPPMHSAHEGYAVILEEVRVLEAEVFKSPSRREALKMRAEAVQLAAMALRFLVDVCPDLVV